MIMNELCQNAQKSNCPVSFDFIIVSEVKIDSFTFPKDCTRISYILHGFESDDRYCQCSFRLFS